MAKLSLAGPPKFGRYYGYGLAIGLLVIICIGRQVGITNFQQSSIDNEKLALLENNKQQIHRRPGKSTKNPLIIIPQPVDAKGENLILDYHKKEEEWCQQKIANRSGVNWCPCVPKGLQGRVTINMVDNESWSTISESVGMDVRSGGEWKPEDCVSHTRVAIVIPCRDRESHLRILLRHLFPILKRQMIHFRVFVADQRLPMIFNKAATMNIGFLEASKRFPFDCVIFHDVDLLLEDDRALLRCGPRPRHYARALDKFDYHLYPTFGGVVSLTAAMFRKVDGYSLKYFGWGGEDDDMWSRVGQLWKIYGMPAVVSRYSTIFHAEDATNLRNPRRHALMTVGFERNQNKSFEGLTEIVYDVNAVEVQPLFTRFETDINTTFLQYPQHKTFKYRRVPGFCQDKEVILTSKKMSWSSCRFQCDTFLGQNCFGFSYVTGKCTLIRTICNLSLSRGFTYVKEDELKQLQ